MPPIPSSLSDVDTTISRAAWVFFLVCVLVAGAGITWCARTALFVRRAVAVPGVIIAMDETARTRGGRVDSSAGTYHNPVVAYTDSNGVRHEVRSSRSTSREAFETGRQVRVFYDPQAPDQMFIDHTYVLWFAPGLVAALGTFCTLVAGYGLWHLHRA